MEVWRDGQQCSVLPDKKSGQQRLYVSGDDVTVPVRAQQTQGLDIER
jgi:hypothetical protein